MAASAKLSVFWQIDTKFRQRVTKKPSELIAADQQTLWNIFVRKLTEKKSESGSRRLEEKGEVRAHAGGAAPSGDIDRLRFLREFVESAGGAWAFIADIPLVFELYSLLRRRCLTLTDAEVPTQSLLSSSELTFCV
jgi:hypothetical protein